MDEENVLFIINVIISNQYFSNTNCLIYIFTNIK